MENKNLNEACLYKYVKPKTAYNYGCICSRCKEGVRQRSKQYYKYHKPLKTNKLRQYYLNWQRNNKDKTKQYSKKYRKNNPEKLKDWHLKRNYGITIEQSNEMFKIQGGCCLICNANEKLFVDHNHKTGKVRGLLCNNCNKGLGCFKDQLNLLDKAKEYLINAICKI